MAIDYGNSYTKTEEDTGVDYGSSVPLEGGPDDVSIAGSTWQGFIDSLTLGFSDEITAATRSIWSDKDYAELVAEERKELEDAKASNPKAFMAGQVGGTAASFLIPGGIFVKSGAKALAASSKLIRAAKSIDEVSTIGTKLAAQALKEGNEKLAKQIIKKVNAKGGKVSKADLNILVKGSRLGKVQTGVTHPRDISRSLLDWKVGAGVGAAQGAGNAEGSVGNRIIGAAGGALAGATGTRILRGQGGLKKNIAGTLGGLGTIYFSDEILSLLDGGVQNKNRGGMILDNQHPTGNIILGGA